MGIRWKLILGSVVPLVAGMVVLCVVFAMILNAREETRLHNIRTANEEAVKNKLKGEIDITFAIVSNMKDQGATQDECLSFLEGLRFGNSGYVWVHSYDPKDPEKPRMLMHPTKPDLNGKDLSGYSDKQKCPSISYEGQIYPIDDEKVSHVGDTKLFVAMNQRCKEAGEGEVRYYWPKPKEGGGATEEGYLKLSWVKLMPDWGWVLGTGEYADDIDRIIAEEATTITAATRTMITYLVLGFVALALVLGGIAWYSARGFTRAIQNAMTLSETISQGDLSMRLTMDRKDEIGRLATSLNEMVSHLESKAKVARVIADGDLTHDVEMQSQKDVLGQALKTMSFNLNKIISQVNDAASQVATGSQEVSSSSQSLSQGATEQASSLQEITSSMTELDSQTRTNAENATLANTHAAAARDSAENGAARMQEMVSAMGQINESSQQISKIIKVIDDIAFQTNLLALNAAVEAARAGRHGKGFAVVAEEVRNLAARSAKAASETGGLIEGSADKVKNGMDIATQTAEALKEIVDGVNKATDLVGEIAAASNEQALGISQVNEGLRQIEVVTQQNTATAEETASASEELSSQAMHMNHLLTRFKLKGQVRSAKPPVEVSSRPAKATKVTKEKPSKREETEVQAPTRKQNPSPFTQGVQKEPVIQLQGDKAPKAGWGAQQGKRQGGDEDPEIVISLDDNEFGRY